MGEGFCRKTFTLAASETDGLKARREVEMQSAESCAFFLVGSTAVPSSEVKQTGTKSSPRTLCDSVNCVGGEEVKAFFEKWLMCATHARVGWAEKPIG